ncbi:MAG: glycerophosphoryl diester phosphodiesterase [Pseudomonadota bacterium]
MSQLVLPSVMGHRGAAALAPENTLISMRTAADQGAEWIEFDVMLTGDDVPVMFHDDKLERTTGQAGLMAETSFEATRGLDAGAWFGADFAGEPLPSLRDAVSLLQSLKVRANIEIKPSAGREEITGEAVMKCLTEIWPSDVEPPLISSFKPACLEAAQEWAPDWPRSLLVLAIEDDWHEIMQRYGCLGLHCHWERLQRGQIDPVKDAGYVTACFTVNEPAEAVKLWEWGVDCMISDDPARILAALRSR